MAESNGRRVVLVTGATGFTGGCLARELNRRGYRVRAMVRRPDVPAARALAEEGITLTVGDVTNPGDVNRAVEGVEDVYHIAALYRSAKHGDEVYHRVNADGPRYVADAARAHGCRRLIHCSTVGVHGDVGVAVADEQAPFKPGDIYQRTKLEGELSVREAIDAGLPGVIFRPAGIYGPGDLRFLKLFRGIASGWFRMLGKGEIVYHLTYIDDLVDGIIRCGEHEAALGQTYVLAGPRARPIQEIAEAIACAVGVRAPRGGLPIGPFKQAAAACEAVCRPLGIEPPLHRRRLDFFIKNRAFISARAHRELGYEPKVDIEEGMQRTAEWYYQEGLLARRTAPPEARSA